MTTLVVTRPAMAGVESPTPPTWAVDPDAEVPLGCFRNDHDGEITFSLGRYEQRHAIVKGAKDWQSKEPELLRQAAREAWKLLCGEECDEDMTTTEIVRAWQLVASRIQH